MKAEYKRDMNGNYLVLYEKEEPDTSSYQMRMLVGNTIPSVLKCRVQGIDGQFMVCFDITSKQSLLSLYEEKKMGYEDLQMIFGGFVQVMEEMSEYLLNPCRLILKPEYMYVDVEKRQLYFCYLPGYEQDVRQKFQELTEYILPILDHEDSKAVMLGYGIYRRALEDSFHLEYIKKELYQEREAPERSECIQNMQNEKETLEKGIFAEEAINLKTPEPQIPCGKEDDANVGSLEGDIWRENDNAGDKKTSKERTKGILIWCGISALAALVIVIGETLGYLPRISVAAILGGTIAAMAAGMLCAWLVSLRKKHKEKPIEKADKKTGISDSNMEKSEEIFPQKEDEYNWLPEDNREMISKNRKMLISPQNCGETVVLSANIVAGPATLVSKEPGELATIYLRDDLTVIGKMETAADAVINLPTVSRIHAKIRKKEGEYYLTDLNSRNGTSVNGKMLKGDEEYCLQDQDEVDFAQARYVFIK